MNSVRHSEKFRIAQQIERVFPLFSAEGERVWVPGWDYVNVMGSTDLHEDYIFLTTSHDHAGSDAIWIVKRYEPENHFVQFYRVEPGVKVGVISIVCSQVDEKLTEVEVTYQYTALNTKGEEFIAGFTSSQYKDFIAEWHRLLVSYFGSKSQHGMPTDSH
ncbi:MAG: hypothetical protein JW846_06280 [Dehalococcoidia bacterium]|nr:hypothetical protein [Dehalococcoidia bacterium]